MMDGNHSTLPVHVRVADHFQFVRSALHFGRFVEIHLPFSRQIVSIESKWHNCGPINAKHCKCNSNKFREC